MTNADSGAAPTTTHVLWSEVTDAQLEELLFGLLDAMGANTLVWRAGSATGVTASDGGRDIEATFDRPSPDGELDRQLWWVESKGRRGTVERGAVQQAILNVSARSDVDVLVIATNSRFSNPTRDWVSDRQRTSPRPQIRLWDRESLDRLVRRYPTVAARVLPAALDDGDRLSLLVERFYELGEEPTEPDRSYYWERKNNLQQHDRFCEAVGMFLYSEGKAIPRDRAWWRLIDRPTSAIEAMVLALINFPAYHAGNDTRPRPLLRDKTLGAAARLLAAAIYATPEEVDVAEMILNPWDLVVDGEEISQNQTSLDEWRNGPLRATLIWLAADVLDACAGDCLRVSADNPHELESLSADAYWRLLSGAESGREYGTIAMEQDGKPCSVDLQVQEYGCPLVPSNQLPIELLVQQVVAVLRFRRLHPTDAKPARPPEPSVDRSPMTLTILYEDGLAWKTVRLGDDKKPSPSA